MDNRLVVDASVCVSWLEPQDANHEASRLWIEQYFIKGGTMTVPTLLLIEVAAAISRRTGEISLAQTAVKKLEAATATNTIDFIPIDASLVRAAVGVATNLQLRAGDAIYVTVARQHNIPLISWDKEQLQRSASLITTYTPNSYVF